MGVSLNPSTLIVAAVLGAFILYLAANNRLAEYVALLMGQGTPAAAGGGGTTTGKAPGESGGGPTQYPVIPGLPVPSGYSPSPTDPGFVIRTPQT